jgi:hypothetical protein
MCTRGGCRAGPHVSEPTHTGWMGRADEDGDGPRAVVSAQDVVFCFSFLFLFSFQIQTPILNFKFLSVKINTNVNIKSIVYNIIVYSFRYYLSIEGINDFIKISFLTFYFMFSIKCLTQNYQQAGDASFLYLLAA